MMKMQPVPEQDRPKLIAVVVGIAVALTFLARSLSGTPIQAQSGGPETAAARPSSPVAASAGAPLASAELAGGGILPAPQPEDQVGAAVSSGEPEGLPLTDPFRPVERGSAGITAPSSRPTAATRSAAPKIPSTPACSGRPLAPPAGALPPGKLSKPARVPGSMPASERAAPTILYGTVCQGRSGVAILRGAGKSTFVRAGETISGWRITNIRLGQMGVSRAATHRRVRVGEALPVE